MGNGVDYELMTPLTLFLWFLLVIGLILMIGLVYTAAKIVSRAHGEHLYVIYIENEHQIILHCILCDSAKVINRRRESQHE